MPFFSVVLTTYNRATLLKRALDSLFSQTETDWEAVLIDDGSTDDTETIVRPYLQAGKQLRYVKQENGGFIAAKNRGIHLSKGTFLTFLDSDDEFAPTHLANRRTFLEKHPEVDLLHGGAKVIGNQYVPDSNHPDRQILVTDCAISGTFFIRRQLMLEMGCFKGTPLSVDANFMEQALARGLKVVKTNVPTYIYHRDVESSVTLDMLNKLPDQE